MVKEILRNEVYGNPAGELSTSTKACKLTGLFAIRQVYRGHHTQMNGTRFEIVGIELRKGLLPRFTIRFPKGEETEAEYFEVFEIRGGVL